MANTSVERYKRIVALKIPPAVKKAGMDMLEKHANIMASYVRQATPKRTHVLEHTINVYRQDELLRVTVVAGGKGTRHAVNHGQSPEYDYARADEFGTKRMAREPYFWPVYRLLKKARIRAVKSAMTRALKKEFHD